MALSNEAEAGAAGFRAWWDDMKADYPDALAKCDREVCRNAYLAGRADAFRAALGDSLPSAEEVAFHQEAHDDDRRRELAHAEGMASRFVEPAEDRARSLAAYDEHKRPGNW